MGKNLNVEKIVIRRELFLLSVRLLFSDYILSHFIVIVFHCYSNKIMKKYKWRENRH